jgi:hypothetical protein
LVVLEKLQDYRFVTYCREEIQHGHSFGTQSESCGDNFSLRSAVTNGRLLLRDSHNWEFCFATGNVQVDARRRTLGVITTSEIGIGEQSGLRIIVVLAYPPNLSIMQSGVDITHKTMQFAVTISVPLRNTTG